MLSCFRMEFWQFWIVSRSLGSICISAMIDQAPGNISGSGVDCSLWVRMSDWGPKRRGRRMAGEKRNEPIHGAMHRFHRSCLVLCCVQVPLVALAVLLVHCTSLLELSFRSATFRPTGGQPSSRMAGTCVTSSPRSLLAGYSIAACSCFFND